MKFTNAAMLLFAIGVASAPVRSATAQTVCPTGSDNPESRDVIQMFLTDPAYAEERELAGLTSLDITHLRVLNDASDLKVCQALRDRITAQEYFQSPWVLSFYEVDGYYFMPFVRGPIEQTRIRVENGRLYGSMYPVPLVVYDRALTRVLNIAM